MMTNLFSMFDPSSMSISSSWFTQILILFIPLIHFSSKFSSMFYSIKKSIELEMSNISPSNLTISFMSSTFMTILLLNLLALLPFTFTANSQMSIVLPLGLTFWTSIFLKSLILKTNSFLSHLVPLGTPNGLMPIMVLIELTSNIIRPITLSVRLMANLTAGHLLMHLLSSFSISSNLIIPMLPVSLILTVLESAVAVIQAYIFSILLTLYSSEIH